MTDRWNDVERIVQSALTRTPHERAAFVADACAGDSALHAEVESLLAHETAADHLLSTPAAALMAISDDTPAFIGRHFGTYTILELLGVGGMGEVYRARDRQLDRDVAIKILPPMFIKDADRLVRFEREAKILAALNHPQIGAIYGLERVDGVPALVLELVEGPTLAERLSQGALDIKDALLIAMQIADALEVAHRQGIIHRDLKPANIKVTATGLVKLLDFGLAKGAEQDDSSKASNALTVPVTTSRTGAILGTAAYMSPEQARGERVDARSDLFSLGAVLYEMVTGRPAFRGDTASAILRAILHDTPPSPRAINPRVPAALENVVMRLLAKDRGARHQHASDVRIGLQRLASELDSGAFSWLRRWGRSGGVAAAIILVGIGIWSARRPVPGATLTIGTATQVTADDGLEIDPALSPDGKLLAYASGPATSMRLFIRPVAGGRTLTLSETGAAFEHRPKWSPDGSQILFLTHDGAYVASALGGTSTRVVAGVLAAATWSPDGTRVLVAREGALSIASLHGSGERVIATGGFELHSCDWSQNDWIACASGNARAVNPGGGFGNVAPSAIVVVSAQGGALTTVADRTSSNLSPAWSPDGARLYFVSNRDGPRDIYEMDAPAGGSIPAARRVTTGLGLQHMSLASKSDRLTYVAYAARANIWSLPVPTGGAVDASRAQPLTSGNQIVESMRVSRDGKWLIFDSTLHLNAEIFRVPIGGGPPERLTTDPADDFAGDLSPDGRELAYHSWRAGSRDVYVKSLSDGNLHTVTATPAQESYPMWSPDGTAIAFISQRAEGGFTLGPLQLVRRKADGTWTAPETLAVDVGVRSAWLPDGSALVAARNGGIAVIPIDKTPARVVYSPAPGSTDPAARGVAVSGDGRTVYFKSIDAQGLATIWAVPTAGGRPQLLVRFTDPSRPSIRVDFAAGAGRLFFTLEDRQADIWVGEISHR
jgi:Tol biopolymer transport system component